MKKYKQKLSLLALCMSLPVLNACDSGPSDTGSDITLTGRGLNVKELTSKPTEQAPFPSSLAASETLLLNFSAEGDADAEEVLNLTVNSAQQIIINRFNYLFRRGSDVNLALLRLSETDRFITSEVESQFAKLVSAGIGVPGSLAEALIINEAESTEEGRIDLNEREVKTIFDAARSLGYETRLNPDTDLIEIRSNQFYQFSSTGNNQGLLNNKQIIGKVRETVQWRGISLESPVDTTTDDRVVGGRYTIKIEEITAAPVVREGTFILTLGSLTNL